MFKNLKEKLKGWAKRAEEDEETEIIEVEKKAPKKTQKTSKSLPLKSEKLNGVLTKGESKNKKDSPLSPKNTPKAPKTEQKVAKPVPKEKNTDQKESKKQSFLKKLISKKEEAPEKPEEEKPKKVKKTFLKKALTEDKYDELWDELELILMQNNIAYEAIDSLKKSLKKKLVGESTKINIEDALKEAIEELLQNPPSFIDDIKEKLKEKKPYIILFAGINGAGKTTTIAKVANLLKKNKLSVCLASADTFRAAAIEQLQVHADRLEVPLVKKDYGSDPASVGFDAVAYAKKNKIDVVLIDTAGRMNNRDTLMKEITKIEKVTSPDLTIFLGESITGNDATQQAKDFNNSINIDGMILSKADVDEKGGTAISVSHVTKKPIYFLGVGQGYNDLEVFDKEKLVDRIFGED